MVTSLCANWCTVGLFGNGLLHSLRFILASLKPFSSFGVRIIGTKRVSHPRICGGVLLLEDLYWSNNGRKLTVESKNMAIHSRVTSAVVHLGIAFEGAIVMWSRSYEKLLRR